MKIHICDLWTQANSSWSKYCIDWLTSKEFASVFFAWGSVRAKNKEHGKTRRESPFLWCFGKDQDPVSIKETNPKTPQVSRSRDRCLILPDGSEIWQASPQQCCRATCQIAARVASSVKGTDRFSAYKDFNIRIVSSYLTRVWATPMSFLFFNMWLLIPGRRRLYIETQPWLFMNI